MTIHIFPLNDAPSRATRYAARLDEELPKLSGNEARLRFLLQKRDLWEMLYGQFLERLKNPEYDPGDKSAFDFAMTISEIDVRIAKYEGARHA